MEILYNSWMFVKPVFLPIFLTEVF